MPPALVQRLVVPLEARFAAPVVVDPPRPVRPEWLDRERGRYDAGAILQALQDPPPTDGGWRLALLAGDLVAAGVRSAAGVATIGGCCGVLALAPLDPGAATADAQAADLFFRRTLTEAVHEIGHLAGLAHCPDEDCAMYYAATIAETDRKSPNFCQRCRR